MFFEQSHVLSVNHLRNRAADLHLPVVPAFRLSPWAPCLIHARQRPCWARGWSPPAARCRSGGLDGADENKRPFLWEGAGPPGLGGASGVRGGAQSPSPALGGAPVCGGPGFEARTHPFADGHSLLGHGLGVSHVVLHDGLEELILVLPFEGRLRDRGRWASGRVGEGIPA